MSPVAAPLRRPTPTVPAGRPTTVLVVDDQVTFADLLSEALTAAGMVCVGVAHTAAQAVQLAERLQPDQVVMDVSLPDTDGLTATRLVRDRCPHTVVTVLTAHQDPAWVVRATQAGAGAFVPKNGSLHQLLEVLRAARNGPMVIAPSTFSTPAAREVADGVAPALTRREQEVLELLAGGLPVKAVGRALGISVETCRGYVKSLHAKLGVASQVELVVRAQRLGLLAVPAGR